MKKMSNEQIPKSTFKNRLLSRRRKGWPCTRWLDSVVMGVRGLRGKTENRVGCRKVVEKAKAHYEL
jgi:hypothetical protein